jgi:hypothetical protein
MIPCESFCEEKLLPRPKSATARGLHLNGGHFHPRCARHTPMSIQRGSYWFQKRPQPPSLETFSFVGSRDSSGIFLNTHAGCYLIKDFLLDKNHCKTSNTKIILASGPML